MPGGLSGTTWVLGDTANADAKHYVVVLTLEEAWVPGFDLVDSKVGTAIAAAGVSA